MIIDAHVHITPPEIIENWRKVAASEPYFSLLSHGKANGFADKSDILSYMDSSNIDMSVIFGFAFEDMSLCKLCNKYVISCVEEHPDRFIGGMIINPTSSDAHEEITRCHEAGLSLIGELFPDGQHWDIQSSEATSQICELALKLNLPIMIHGNEDVGHYYPGKTTTNAKKLEQLAISFPENNFIFAHWGGGLALFELMKNLPSNLKNVYYDTAATHYLYKKQIYSLVEQLSIQNKLLFGSDFPLKHSEQIIDDVKSNLPNASLGAVLGDNIFKLLMKKPVE